MERLEHETTEATPAHKDGQIESESSSEIDSELGRRLAEHFDTDAILEHFRDAWSGSVRDFEVMALVAYIELDGIAVDTIPELPDSWKEYIAEQKREGVRSFIVNPGLYLMTTKECANAALAELLNRVKANDGAKDDLEGR